MKKVYFIAVLVFFAAFSYADDVIAPLNNNIYVEGTASRADHREFFQTNFNMEATALGYTLTDNKSEAGFIYRYNVVPNMVVYNGIEQLASADESQYVIQMSVIRNEDNFEVLSYNVPFTDLNELYEYNQFLFFRSNLPFAESEPVYVYPDTSWRDKWIYLRASFDYPISFYVLQPDGLFAGKALWNGTNINAPDNFSIPLNHRVSALPGATVGVEVQFLNFMSLEVNFQVSLGDTVSNKFLNMAAGAQLKFPLKFVNTLMIEPYGAFTYPLNKSENFASVPPFLIGGGVQVCTKGGKSGAFFIDVNYMFSFRNTAMKNLYKVKDASDSTDYLYSNPQAINYKRFVIGLGVGYKFGLFNRKK
jgi:hypothetical protein